jgi:DNA repair photolyase
MVRNVNTVVNGYFSAVWMLMPTKYEEVSCKKGLDNLGILGTRLWTRHCFDPYVNCQFNCTYCGFGTQKRERSRDFSVPVYAKLNAPQVLDRELSTLKRKGVVSLGGATDVYQQAEENYGLTRQILEVLMKHNCPFAIGTKSDLILRDLNLISEASRKSWCCISWSITTLDEKMAKLLEPNAPSPKRRLEALRSFSKEGITTGVWLSPVLPYITDKNENIASVIKAAVENGAKFVLGCGLDMRDPTRFRMFLEEKYPRLPPKYEKLYDWKEKPRKHYPDEYYLYDFYKKFISLCQEYGVESFIPHFHTRRQAWLFYIRNFSQFKGTPVFEATQLLNYLSPSKELLQSVNIRCGNLSVAKGLLKAAHYFPH